MSYQVGAIKGALGMAALCAASFAATTANAQTWSNGTTTPWLGDIITLDPTGEPDWLFGFEDLLGDGDTFTAPEQSIDLRSAYAETDPSKLWFRSYVSSPDPVGANVVVYVFINADTTFTTGGPVNEDIDPAFTSDPTMGGYEFAFGVAGDGTIVGIWAWNDADGVWDADLNPNPSEAVGEGESDVDPILVGEDVHGYLQATINLDRLGLTQDCDAILYVRSIDTDTDDEDRDAGLVSPCHPADADGDGIPDIIVPEDGCETNDDCPFDGVCLGGVCFFTEPCNDDADCDADEVCDADGRCVAVGGGECVESVDCDGLVCDNGLCILCVDDASCGDGFVCGPDGRCIDQNGGEGGGGVILDPGDVVRGGPCACRTVGEAGEARAWLAALLVGLVALWRRGVKR